MDSATVADLLGRWWVRYDAGEPRLAALHVVLDTEESVAFSERKQPAAR